IERLPAAGTLTWMPVRRHLGVAAFGLNAYTAASPGDEVIEDHTESGTGHEEVYLVLRGRVRFTLDGEEVTAPAGTVVFLPRPARRPARRGRGGGTRRARHRREAGRGVSRLAVGVLLRRLRACGGGRPGGGRAARSRGVGAVPRASGAHLSPRLLRDHGGARG